MYFYFIVCISIIRTVCYLELHSCKCTADSCALLLSSVLNVGYFCDLNGWTTFYDASSKKSRKEQLEFDWPFDLNDSKLLLTRLK